MANENQMREESSQQTREAQTEASENTRAVIDYNLRFYTKGCEVPEDALKKIKAGRLSGMSDVNPMWRMRRMTEIFGPVGFGWKYEIARQWTESYGEEVKCFCNILLYVRDPETREWSEPIPGSGGSSIVAKERSGPYVNDEAYKMALTDALSIAMKPLGIGGNIWYGPKATGHNESKYEEGTREEQPSGQQTQPRQTRTATSAPPAYAYTGEQMKKALEDLAAVTTEQQFYDLWNAYQNGIPAICQPGTDFYKASCDKINQIRSRR